MFGLGVRSSLGGSLGGSKSLLGVGGVGGVPSSSPLGAVDLKAGSSKLEHVTEQANLSLKLLNARDSREAQDAAVFQSVQERHKIGESDPADLALKVTTALENGTAGASSSTPAALKRRAAPKDQEELAAIADAVAARNLPAKATAPNPDPDPKAHWDFDFDGNGRPYRFARGKAARLLNGSLGKQASREAVMRARAQLRGLEPIEFVQRQGAVRHVNPNSAVASLGENGDPDCGAHRIFRPGVRSNFRDFIVEWVCTTKSERGLFCGPHGLRYTSLGSGQLLFDLELLERLRGKGVYIGQICLIDKAYQSPTMEMRRVLREFADWHRAISHLERKVPPGIYLFGHTDDYLEAATVNCAVGDCHLFVHCDAHWDSALSDCERLAKQTLVSGGMLARLNPKPFLFPSEKRVEGASHLHAGNNTDFSVAAWTLTARDKSLQYLEDDMLQKCVLDIATASAESLDGDVSFAQQRARGEWKILEKAKAKKLDEEAETKRVEAEIHAHNQRADARDAQAKEYADALVRRDEIIIVRQEASKNRKAKPSEPKAPVAFQKYMEELRIRVCELEEKGWSLWKVVHDGEVNVHVTAKDQSRIVANLSKGMEVVAGQVHGDWIQIVEDPEVLELPLEAWVRHSSSAGGHGAILSRLHLKDLEESPRRAG